MKKLEERTLRVWTAVAILILPACGRKHHVARSPYPPPRPAAVQEGTRNKPLAAAVGYTETGMASWYGIPYHGRPAADGEIYDMETLVAAHRLMPFNTWLRVTNLTNGKRVDVRVIDRGPFVDGRIIDLSKAAARQIDLLGPGVGQVKLEVIAAPPDIPSNDVYAVQVGAFSIYANAERARATYAAKYGAAQIAVKQGNAPLWRVLVGHERSVDAAQELASRIKADSNLETFVVRMDQTQPPAPASAPASE
ncbi:MAG: septal ring lytic transglycosylase RlpA family protein [Acidobacteriaceae bacterium]|nr:septal ring lytic transglycosylase RlpA family protein [Acidobacteriaceae bacterium]